MSWLGPNRRPPKHSGEPLSAELKHETLMGKVACSPLLEAFALRP